MEAKPPRRPKGYEDTPIYQFIGIPDLRERVQSLAHELAAGHTTKQHLIFWNVTKNHLAQIDHQRASINRGIRMTYHTDINILIVKVPTAKHELAHLLLSEEVEEKLREMGLPRRSMIRCGATTYDGSSTSKEGDSSYKPKWCRAGKSHWRTLVFEAGLSESLAGLRTDAQWWLTNSGGEVNIVIVISIVPEERSLRIEQWCMSLPTRPRPATRVSSNANPSLVPMSIQELTIIQNPPIPPLPGTIPTYAVTGAPLTLEFEKLLLRAPVPPEGNVILTVADLQAFAWEFWSVLK